VSKKNGFEIRSTCSKRAREPCWMIAKMLPRGELLLQLTTSKAEQVTNSPTIVACTPVWP
jgi:hypothetical protein